MCFAFKEDMHSEEPGIEYYELNICIPPNLYIEALTSSMAVFGGGVSKEVIKVKEDMRVEP